MRAGHRSRPLPERTVPAMSPRGMPRAWAASANTGHRSSLLTTMAAGVRASRSVAIGAAASQGSNPQVSTGSDSATPGPRGTEDGDCELPFRG